MNEKKSLSIALSLLLIILGLIQWFEPTESSLRWKWFQDLSNQIFGQNGYAKVLVFVGGFWFLWIMISFFVCYFKRSKA
ncbi:hypothetical protein [Paracidovorax wautersii]|uniref:hypothetical protein n=1 Tax=Paracidovorax wautersii TaxID=1177982 RepID=UPI0031E1423D